LYAVKQRRKDCKNQGKNSIYCDKVQPKRDAWWIAEAGLATASEGRHI
jgi:hypothetical protein